jgi:hypothetical protein
MPKRPNLSAVAAAAGSRRPVAAPLPPPATPSPAAKPARARSRLATKQIAAHFPPEVAWQLRELAVQRRTTSQALLAEALNMLFERYGKPPLASVEPGRPV